MLRVGLTGGIACGKSHVLRRLAVHGLHTLDLDAVAHEVMAPGGSAHRDVVEAFGPGILTPDGEVDRKALAAIVFADTEARERLNAIVHPRVREEGARRARAHASEPGSVYVTDAALLVEGGVHLRFDRLIVVHCHRDEQVRRLRARDGVAEGAARARLAAQMPIEEKRRFAHFQVDTSGSLEETHRRADRLAEELKELALRPPRPVSVPAERALGCLVHGPAAGPRGLDPSRLLAELAATGGPEMGGIARLLSPPGGVPWYRSAREQEAGPGPETLAGALVLWTLAGRGADAPFLLAAAASLARLTHRDPAAVAAACLAALALHEVAASGALPGDLEPRLVDWGQASEPWAGVLPPARVEIAVRAARSGDPLAARRAAREAGGEPDLAGALAGMIAGIDPAAAPPDLRALVAALGGSGRP